MPARRQPPGTTHHPGSSRISRPLGASLACAVAAIIVATAGCAATGSGAPAGPAPSASTTGASPTLGSKGGTLPGSGYPAVYWVTIRQQLASGLHRSVTELTRLWGATAPAGPKGSGGQATTTITDVAAEDGLSTGQLRALELAAIRQAFTAVVQRRTITRSQADNQLAAITSWDQASLDGYAMSAFQPH